MDGDRVDVRRQPLVVRDGCAPERTPAGRWPSDSVLVRSEQFAVNEALAALAGGGGADGDGIFGMHAPPGTGVSEVFGDLVAAVITERARHIADLPDPAAAFDTVLTWGAHTVSAPVAALAGFEIVQSAVGGATVGSAWAAPDGKAPGAGIALPPIGARWRDRASRADYFASSARLSDGVGAWAMLVARLGDQPANRAFAERWWHGTVRGTDVLFPAGESMVVALRQLKGRVVNWPTAVAWFKTALEKVHNLAAERMRVSAALTRLSVLEQECEEASGCVEEAQALLAVLTEREPGTRDAVIVAEEEYRAALAALGAHDLGRPTMTTVTPEGVAAMRGRGALSVALAGSVRRGKNWRTWTTARREQRAACTAAERRWDQALRDAELLRAEVTAARAAAAAGIDLVGRLAGEMEPLAATVAAARQRWGDHVPAGPSQAETEDPALIEWRETTAPWADEEYAQARAQVFIAALELHKALIAAQGEAFEANLALLMELIVTDGAACPPEVLLAAWQSFFLVVPVMHVPLEAAGALLGGLGDGALGWLLADGADQLAADEQPGLLRWFERVVFAGDTVLDTRHGAGRPGGRRVRYGTWLPAQPADPADDAEPRWVGMPLRVVRGQDRSTVDRRNDLAYDGLLISDRE